MPLSFGPELAEWAPRPPGDVKPQGSITGQFYGGTLDPGKMTRENIVFFFCMDPKKFVPMMDGVAEFTPEQVEETKRLAAEMVTDKHKVLIGVDRLKALNKKVGEHFTIHSMNYKDIDLDVEVI